MSNDTKQAPAPVRDESPEWRVVLSMVRDCAAGWEPQACLVGNARAGDIVRACDAVLLEGATRDVREPLDDDDETEPCEACGKRIDTEREPYTVTSEREFMCDACSNEARSRMASPDSTVGLLHGETVRLRKRAESAEARMTEDEFVA